jgi:tripartite ATP-independent transporter DctM subunit
MISLEMMPPLMFAGLIIFMLIGYPVAFTLAALGLFCGFISVELGFFPPEFLQAIPGRIYGSILSNELLLAIPFFTFMGAILEKCGLAEDMLDGMGQLFGPVRGGLGYSVIIVGFILGAITGTVAAQVIAMALISLPVMMRYNYNMKYATGVLAASGTITQLVPPSLVLVVLADQLGKSVGDMYLGAWGPSLIQVGLFCVFTFLVGIFKPHWVPAVPKADRTLHGWALWKKCLWGIIPAAVLIFLVLGTLLMGLATPTEGGAMGTWQRASRPSSASTRSSRCLSSSRSRCCTRQSSGSCCGSPRFRSCAGWCRRRSRRRCASPRWSSSSSSGRPASRSCSRA